MDWTTFTDEGMVFQGEIIVNCAVHRGNGPHTGSFTVQHVLVWYAGSYTEI